MIKELDKFILKQYTKLANKWEKKYSIYALNNGLNMAGLMFGLAGIYLNKPLIEQQIFTYSGSTLGITMVFGTNLFRDMTYWNEIDDFFIKKQKKSAEDILLEQEILTDLNNNYIIKSFKQLHELTRLPFLLIGTGLVIQGAYQIADSMIQQNPVQPYTFSSLSLGLGFLGFASVQYLKDKDPKLLDKNKESIFKKAYNKLKDFTNSLFPPKPVPVPIKNKEILQEYSQIKI